MASSFLPWHGSASALPRKTSWVVGLVGKEGRWAPDITTSLPSLKTQKKKPSYSKRKRQKKTGSRSSPELSKFSQQETRKPPVENRPPADEEFSIVLFPNSSFLFPRPIFPCNCKFFLVAPRKQSLGALPPAPPTRNPNRQTCLFWKLGNSGLGGEGSLVESVAREAWTQG